MSELEELFAKWEREARTFKGLKELRDWYRGTLEEVYQPYEAEAQRVIAAGKTLSSKDRDEIEERTGVAVRKRQLQKIYEEAVEEFMGHVAGELTNPNSDAYREVITKYDRAWKELAQR
jgi:hypothetical protein